MGSRAEIEKEKQELLKEEVKKAIEGEVGADWLAEKPLGYRILVQFLRIFTVFVALYFFLVSLSLMGDGFSALTGKSAGGLFEGQDNVFVGLMIGILATVLVQSSSTTTSIIVVLVGNDIIEVQTAVPMIMGANIGTSVTNTIVSLGFVDDLEAYRKGFSGATVHDMFNYLNVAVLLPAELIVSNVFNNGNGGILQIVSEAISEGRGEGELEGGEDFEDANPIKKITNPILDEMIDINKDVIKDYAQGFPDRLEGEDETTNCSLTFEFENDENNVEELGCIDLKCEFCNAGEFGQDFNASFYDAIEKEFDDAELISGGAFQRYGDTGGGVFALVLSLVMMIVSLFLIVKMLTALVQGAAQRILVGSLNQTYPGGNYVSIIIGCGITFIVQSSSITTSILTPLVAVGALELEAMFPYTLGANIGTTGTGLIAAAADGKQDGYTIAMVHLFFNIFGVLIWYPIPRVRAVPLNAARFLGEMASIWRLVPIIYLFLAFLFYPLVFFGFSTGFRSDNDGSVVVSVILFLAFAAMHIYAFYFYHFRDGKRKFIEYINEKKETIAESHREYEDATALKTAADIEVKEELNAPPQPSSIEVEAKDEPATP